MCLIFISILLLDVLCYEISSFKVIAATVASDPEKYNEAFLGKPNAEYCAWILDSEKWGGVHNLFPPVNYMLHYLDTKLPKLEFENVRFII